MGQVQTILDKLAAGESVEQIAQQFLWPQLSLEDRERLLQEAEIRGQKGDHQLIRWLAKAVSYPNSDRWDRIQVAILFARHVDDESRRGIRLKRIRSELDSLASRITDKVDMARLSNFKGDYCVLNANLELDRDDLISGVQHLEHALKLYTDGGCEQYKSAVTNRLDRLRYIQEKRHHFLPLDEVESWRADLEYQVINLETKTRQKTEQVSQLTRAVQDLQQKIADLEQSRRQTRDDQVRLAADVKTQSERLNTLRRDGEEQSVINQEALTQRQRLEQTVVGLTEQYSDITRTTAALKKERDDLQVGIDLLKKEKTRIESLQLDKLRQEELQLKLSIADLKKQQSEYAVTSVSQQMAIQTDMAELARSRDEIGVHIVAEQSKLDKLKDQNMQLKEIISQLEKQKTDLESQLKNINTRKTQAGEIAPKLPSFMRQG